MMRREFTAAVLVLALQGHARAALNEADAAAGVRLALERGALAAVGLLGREGGFMGNPRVRIPLPGILAKAAKVLRATGQGKQVDELELAMNRAAEAAVPQAKALFVSTVKAMSVEDALHLVRGGTTSVTDFFAAKTRSTLTAKFLPIVDEATRKLALAQRYDAVAAQAARLGLLKGEHSSVQSHVTQRALDGLFLMIGEEEKKIRADPARSGSALIRRVFGA